MTPGSGPESGSGAPTASKASKTPKTPKTKPPKSRSKPTPMMAQYLSVKAEHPDALLLFRMGDFYETFFEDAEILSRVTGITLTSRNAGEPDPIPLAGFPWHSSESHLAKLLAAGQRVAICEQVEEPGPGKKLLERKVVEILSPGTALADSQLLAGHNNFVVALHLHKDTWGLAAADVSTGELWAGDLSRAEAEEEMARLAPAEVLWTSQTAGSAEGFLDVLERAPFTSEAEDWTFGHERSRQLLLDQFRVSTLDGFECDELGPGLSAAGALLHYAREQKQSDLGHIGRMQRLRPRDGLVLDEATLRSLEVLEPMPGADSSSTLVSVLDRTLTAGGGRRLRRILRRPSVDPIEIQRRQEGVERLLSSALRDSLRDALRRTADVERILARLHCGRTLPRDLGALRSTLAVLPQVEEKLREIDPTAAIWPRLATQGSEKLRDQLGRALVDELPATLADGGIFRPEWDAELAEARSLASDGKKWIAELQEKERQATGIPNLKVGFNRVFGYFLEVTKAHHDKVPDHYQRKQTLVGAERYLTPELKEFEQKVLTAEDTAVRRERLLFQDLCDSVTAETSLLQELAAHLAYVDFLQALAEAASRGGWIRPTLLDEPTLRLEDGRHPVVERALGAGRFIANDTALDRTDQQLAILTGPNMAGKSTYLRQVGLLVILAQIGSFVPAAKAEIGLADRVFTRVGAQDSLARGQSTFLLEMVETSRILHHATERSLVLLDEVGRGTSTYDGLAIAWAVAEALCAKGSARPRTIFATHFHELVALAEANDGVFNLNVQVKEWGDEIVFVRKVVPGGADRSYGIHVAQLAGIPESVVVRARDVLAELEKEGRDRTLRIEPDGSKPRTSGRDQLSLFAPPEPAFLDELRKLELDGLAPIEAWQILRRWQQSAGSGSKADESGVD